MNTSLNKLLPWYKGINRKSDRFLLFLESRNAHVKVLSWFRNFSLTGQIELVDGVIFSEREILMRNEFVEDPILIIGVTYDYGCIAIDLLSARFGIADSDSNQKLFFRKKFEAQSFEDYLIGKCNVENPLRATYVLNRFFNLDDIAIMRVFTECGIGKFIPTTHIFREWLSVNGVNAKSHFDKLMPAESFSIGACEMYSWRRIIDESPDGVININWGFIVLGNCPDGGLIVLDKRGNQNTIGYVAFAEVGNIGDWSNSYVKISSSLGAFLHDYTLLGILPDDYYQARHLGYSYI